MTHANTDVEAIHKQLDLAPQDWTLRLVLADWHEEHGDPRRAQFQRWLSTAQKCPMLWADNNTLDNQEWCWFRTGSYFPQASLGKALWDSCWRTGLPHLDHADRLANRSFSTRQAAEEHLLECLKGKEQYMTPDFACD